MKKKIMPLQECSVVYFLKTLAQEIGFFDLSDNKFCQIFDLHQEWLTVFFGRNSSFDPPSINYIEPNKFCELAIHNDWMWKVVDLAQTNGNKLSFDQDQLRFVPKLHFQDRTYAPDQAFLDAIDIYLWFATAVRDCQLSVELDDKSFVYKSVSKTVVETVNPLDGADPATMATELVTIFQSVYDWKKTLKKLNSTYPGINLLHLRDWVRKNLKILTTLTADQLRPLFGLLPRQDLEIDRNLWIDGEPPHIPTMCTDIPNKGTIEHPSGITLTQITVDAIALYCFEHGKEEKVVFAESYDPTKIDTTAQLIGIGPGIFLMLVRFHCGSLGQSVPA